MCRKLIFLTSFVLVLGLVGSASAFQVVDDFESGNLNIWEITEGQVAVAIGPDPTNPSNNCLVFSPETITMRTPWGLLEGKAEMLSYRLMYDKQADGTVTLIFGASDPDGTAWGNYYALARMNSYGDPANIPDMDVRDGGAYTDVVQADLEPLRWYDVLLDIDTASKKYDLYIDGVLVFQGAAFRSGYSPANLEYILLKTTTWENNFANGTVYVDDIVLGEPAAAIIVEAGGDIAAANATAVAGDVIDIAAGTFVLTGQIEIKDGVTYQGAGAGLTIIDGNGTARAFVAWGDRGANNGQVDADGVGVPNATGPKDWVLDGMTIQNCVADTEDRRDILGAARDLLNNYTGAPYTLATAQAENGAFTDNPGWFDILSGSADDNLSDVELQAYLDGNPVGSAGHLVTGDDKNGDGGAITIHNGAVGTIANCEFLNNHTPAEGDGDDGGAVNVTGLAVVTINDCLFDGNYAVSPDSVGIDGFSAHGGHIVLQGASASAITPGTTLIANRCVFLNGNAEDDGGAIRTGAVGTILRLDACWFEANTSWDNGNVLLIGNESSAELTVTNCIFVNNITKADNSPDRMCQVRRNSKFINCTFVGNNQNDQDLIYNNANKADTDADGVDDEMADATQVINCIFANNVVGGGDDVLGSRNASFTIAAVNCLFFGNTLQNGNAADNTQRPAEETGSVLTDPLLDANYVPGAGSPAIDGGVDVSAEGVTTDYNGAPRPQGAAYDIGAYEAP